MKIKVNKYNFENSYHPEIEILCAKPTRKDLKSINNIVIKDDVILDLDKENNLIGVEIFIPKKSLKRKDFNINLKTIKIGEKYTIEIPEDYPLNDFPTIKYTSNRTFSKYYVKISEHFKANHLMSSNNSSIIWELDKDDILTGIYFLNVK